MLVLGSAGILKLEIGTSLETFLELLLKVPYQRAEHVF